MKLKGTHQLLVYADVNLLDRSIHTVKEKKEALVVASRETGLEAHAEKIQYMVKFQDQNAGRSQYKD